jgi:hypothetical protein
VILDSTDHDEADGADDDDPRGPARPQSGDNSGLATAAFDGLTPRQGQAVEALLREPTLNRAAAAAGVTARTLRRWMKDAAFKAAVLTARREAFGQAVGLSQRYAPLAVATLVRVMQDDKASPSARITAAAMLLRFSREGIELDDLIARVEALERSAWGGNGPVAGIADANDNHEHDERERDEPDQED